MFGTSISRCLVISKILLVVVIQPSQGRSRHKLPERQHRLYDHGRDQFNNTYNFDDSSENGPKNWYKKYPDCAGTEQSPIDIVTEDVECDAGLTDFTYQGYDTIQTSPFHIFKFPDSWQVAVFEFEGDGVSIQGAWLPSSKFSFHSLFFYAGPESLHKIDGKSFPLQFGLMHWNSGKYSSNTESQGKPDGEIGLNFIVQIDDELSTSPDNKAFNQAFENVIALAQMNSSCLLTFPMSSLLPNNRVYYKYRGSIVIPPCQAITWVVFEQPLYITHDQMNRYRKIFSNSGKPAKNNGRPTQPLNGRIVKRLCSPE